MARCVAPAHTTATEPKNQTLPRSEDGETQQHATMRRHHAPRENDRQIDKMGFTSDILKRVSLLRMCLSRYIRKIRSVNHLVPSFSFS